MMRKFILIILFIAFAVSGCHIDRRIRKKPDLDIDRESEEYKDLRDLIIWNMGVTVERYKKRNPPPP